jgi:hypothetical protein
MDTGARHVVIRVDRAGGSSWWWFWCNKVAVANFCGLAALAFRKIALLSING